jgi:hypothetical protein
MEREAHMRLEREAHMHEVRGAHAVGEAAAYPQMLQALAIRPVMWY